MNENRSSTAHDDQQEGDSFFTDLLVAIVVFFPAPIFSACLAVEPVPIIDTAEHYGSRQIHYLQLWGSWPYVLPLLGLTAFAWATKGKGRLGQVTAPFLMILIPLLMASSTERILTRFFW
ncbi:hypothetical protein [Burkholderia vietnamiensis]|uniref:hypothetical protein n=1 Tax=Burkholderia vietnamiensis TaxID=60552 RepID=UPI00159370CE|nr:hypothetical protein [Burkholderia vietnamiensis]